MGLAAWEIPSKAQAKREQTRAATKPRSAQGPTKTRKNPTKEVIASMAASMRRAWAGGKRNLGLWESMVKK